jgi:hypothetical protein
MSSKQKQSGAGGPDEHDEGALREAERRMLLHDGADSETGTKDVKTEDAPSPNPNPNDEHDPEALEEASEKMLLRHDRR